VVIPAAFSRPSNVNTHQCTWDTSLVAVVHPSTPQRRPGPYFEESA
jgi:hypothetical protein